MNLWPWRRRLTGEGEDLVDAHKQADRAFRDAKALRCRADDVVGELSRTRDRNHLAAAVVKAIRGV